MRWWWWCVCVLTLLRGVCMAFELQDTIHTLIEENIHLHDQLENLTKALRELRQLLRHNAGEQTNINKEELLHLWEEWSLRGISPDTHHILEQALCHDPHDNAADLKDCSSLLLLFLLLLVHLLI